MSTIVIVTHLTDDFYLLHGPKRSSIMLFVKIKVNKNISYTIILS